MLCVDAQRSPRPPVSNAATSAALIPAGVLTVRNAAAYGRDPAALAAAHRAGALPRLRRGAYALTDCLDPVARHRLLIEAAREVLRPDAVLSHCSAAVWLGLDVPWAALDERVHITRGRDGGSLRPRLATHTGPIPDGQWMVIDGLRVTTATRTTVDVARTAPFGEAVALADHVLRHHGGEGARAEMLALADELKGRKGMVGARRAIGFADPLAENGGESLSRVVLAATGIPEPVLQLDVFDARGWFVGRSDFGWPELGTLGEFDGRVKYAEVATSRGEQPGDVVFREKVREDDLRAARWEVVRWIYADLKNPPVLAARIRAAFARAAARGFAPRGGR